MVPPIGEGTEPGGQGYGPPADQVSLATLGNEPNNQHGESDDDSRPEPLCVGALGVFPTAWATPHQTHTEASPAAVGTFLDRKAAVQSRLMRILSDSRVPDSDKEGIILRQNFALEPYDMQLMQTETQVDPNKVRYYGVPGVAVSAPLTGIKATCPKCSKEADLGDTNVWGNQTRVSLEDRLLRPGDWCRSAKLCLKCGEPKPVLEKVCGICRKCKPKEVFSKTQWSNGRKSKECLDTGREEL